MNAKQFPEDYKAKTPAQIAINEHFLDELDRLSKVEESENSAAPLPRSIETPDCICSLSVPS